MEPGAYLFIVGPRECGSVLALSEALHFRRKHCIQAHERTSPSLKTCRRARREYQNAFPNRSRDPGAMVPDRTICLCFAARHEVEAVAVGRFARVARDRATGVPLVGQLTGSRRARARCLAYSRRSHCIGARAHLCAGCLRRASYSEPARGVVVLRAPVPLRCASAHGAAHLCAACRSACGWRLGGT